MADPVRPDPVRPDPVRPDPVRPHSRHTRPRLVLVALVVALALLGSACSGTSKPGTLPAPAVTVTGEPGYRAVTFKASVVDVAGVTGLQYRTRIGGETAGWSEWTPSPQPALELVVPTGRGGVVADVEVQSVITGGTGPTAAATGTSVAPVLSVAKGAPRGGGRVVQVTGEGLQDGMFTVTYDVQCPDGAPAARCTPPADSTGETVEGRLTVMERTYGGPGKLGVTVHQDNLAIEGGALVGGFS